MQTQQTPIPTGARFSPEALAERAARQKGAGPDWAGRLRAGALERFKVLGFPSPRDEEWRGTDVSPIARGGFELAAASASRRDLAALERLVLGDTPQLVFLDGRLVRELSSASMPAGVRAASLAELLEREPGLLEPHLGRIAGFETHAFTALNTAFLLDGAAVFVEPGAQLERPLHLLFLSTGLARSMSHPRVLVVAGAGSRASVVETFVGLGEEAWFTNAVSELSVGEDASLEHVRVQREGGAAYHVARVQARQAANSRLVSHSFALGAALARVDLGVQLAGEGAECTLNGLYVVGDRQLSDHHTTIDHASPHCSSRELYKGVLGGSGRAVFNGRVVVRKDAQKTNAAQANPNLLLSDDAAVNTRPQLEILADDVKCTHGAAIGRLDADALFYLRARGLAELDARSLLIRAFANEMIERIGYEPLRSSLDAQLVSHLARLLGAREAA